MTEHEPIEMKRIAAAETMRKRMASVDFGKTAEDYGRYRAGFPETLFERLAALGIGAPGQCVLDLGTGTGTLARGFARRGCDVVGLDPAEALLQEAGRLDREAGVTIEYVVGRAEESGLPDRRFDVVTAGQCWHWFDRPRVAGEARRLLVPAGWLVIAHFDWLPLPDNVVEATEALILRHNPSWELAGGNGLHPECLYDAAAAGFDGLETFSYDLAVPYSHEAWRGRVRASSGVAASLNPEQVAAFDADLRQLLAERFPDESLSVAHRLFAMVGRAPA